jgi:acetyltransferase
VPETQADAAPETVAHPRLGAIVIRPVRPGDAARIRAAFAQLAPEDLRMRFFGPMNELPPDMLRHMTRFAPGEEVTFVAETADGALLGGARLVRDPEGAGEFAITIASGAKRQGLGRLLLERLLRHARAQGFARVWGDVLQENRAMLALARRLGFDAEPIADGPEIVRVSIATRAAP